MLGNIVYTLAECTYKINSAKSCNYVINKRLKIDGEPIKLLGRILGSIKNRFPNRVQQFQDSAALQYTKIVSKYPSMLHLGRNMILEQECTQKVYICIFEVLGAIYPHKNDRKIIEKVKIKIVWSGYIRISVK